jgi:hypothetical protein
MLARAICLLGFSRAGSHSSRLRSADFYSCRVSRLLIGCLARPSMSVSKNSLKDPRKELIRRVFRSRLQARETNSPRPGSNLWSPRSSLAPPRRRAHRRPRHGRHSARTSHPLAPRPRRQRQNPDPRTLRLAPKKAPRIRRYSSRRIPHQHKKISLDSAAKEGPRHKEKPPPIAKIQMKMERRAESAEPGGLFVRTQRKKPSSGFSRKTTSIPIRRTSRTLEPKETRSLPSTASCRNSRSPNESNELARRF